MGREKRQVKIVQEEIIYWLYSDVQVSSFFPLPVTAVWNECNVLSWIRGQQRRTLFTLYLTY